MLDRSLKTARVCGLGIVLSSLLSGGAYAADLLTKAPPVPYVDDNFWTGPHLLGDLGRTKLKQQGIDALGGGPREFSRFIAADIEKWTSVLAAAGLRCSCPTDGGQHFPHTQPKR